MSKIPFLPMSHLLEIWQSNCFVYVVTLGDIMLGQICICYELRILNNCPSLFFSQKRAETISLLLLAEQQVQTNGCGRSCLDMRPKDCLNWRSLQKKGKILASWYTCRSSTNYILGGDWQLISSLCWSRFKRIAVWLFKRKFPSTFLIQ